MQALNTIIQLHFDKTLEKKQAVDHQKKQLFTFLHHFFIFLALLLLPLVLGSSHSDGHRLQCKHVWIPLGILSMSHLAFYISVAQTLRCINRFKYQRRCHKLTLGLAAERLRRLRMREESDIRTTAGEQGGTVVELEVAYQEPPESYLWKFKRNWALCFGYLFVCYMFTVTCSFVLLCG